MEKIYIKTVEVGVDIHKNFEKYGEMISRETNPAESFMEPWVENTTESCTGEHGSAVSYSTKPGLFTAHVVH
jgi:hypothetical protein